jgi:tetratricopeptide (TPR) repeat protein
MARAAVKAKQQAKAKAQPTKAARKRGRRGHSGGGNPNQDLFFVRLRRRQKWIYAFLAVIFALTFAGVGVGSGNGGGLDQLYSGLFGGGGDSVSKAQKEIEKNPVKGYRDLATAYEAKGDTVDAITTLERYTNLRSKDVKAWSELAGLQLSQAQDYVTQYQTAYANQQLAAPSQAFRPTGKLGQAIGTDPIEQASATVANSSATDLYQRANASYSAAITSYKTLVRLQPTNANAEFQLANAAQTAGDRTTAVAAYKAYLKLDPSSSTAAQIRQLIKQLSPAPAPSAKKKKK